jgi:hypothetical protein
MKSLFRASVFFVLLFGAVTHAGTDEVVVEKMSGEKVLKGQIARTDLKIGEPGILVAFTQKESANREVDDSDISLNVLVPISKEAYVRASVVACEVEGGAPSLRSFFFIQADRDPDVEIGVICGWDATHQAADCQMNDQVHFYKISMTATPKTVTVKKLDDEKFAAKLYGKRKPEPTSDFECDFARFKSAADVKKIFAKEKLAEAGGAAEKQR